MASIPNEDVSPAQVFASHIIAELALWGRDFWLSPGARSQSLAIAVAQLSEAGLANLYVRLDERSLGFSALGAAVYGGPQVIITTSGTAVANLHPAVLEAHHSGIPLILLTADRPDELRGVGSNQTTNQVGIFSDAVIECIDVPAPTLQELDQLPQKAKELVEKAVLLAWSKTQPIQLNLQFREPLSALTPNAVEVFETIATQSESEYGQDAQETKEAKLLDLSIPTVVIAGATASSYEEEVAALGVPVLAEPSSGLRHLSNAVLNYRTLLASNPELVSEIKQIIVYGKPTLSRPVIALLRSGVQVFVREGQMGTFRIPADSTVVDSVIAASSSDQSWTSKWIAESESVATAPTGSLDRRAMITGVWEATEAGVIVLGASQLIREADFYAPGNKVQVWSNRGLSGIDGTISTATGIALQQGKQVRALMGDLTFLHDASALVIDPEDGPLNIQIIVGNDNGGKIFSSLEVAKTVEKNMFERVFATPQSVDIEKLSEAYGWKYVNPTTVGDFEAALGISGRVIIEVKLS
ncbi:MAG: 2-succinyl-5-enolpyruvyl-6-hydroxy-3-cyclohexene-1-carboxylic-acid synthase [Actinobacteria bacterium]|nr:2-succinyl-5-enolpyruvyl-6-hydroxy-3-cyclohexene-1-carboxylic-acid synthase [Actinomycetota bacterium]